MGDHDDRDPHLLVDALDQLVHIDRHERIEARHGLIEQDDLLCGAQCSRQKNSLLLAAGKIAVTAVPQVCDLQGFHVARGSLFLRLGIKRTHSHARKAAGQDHFLHACRKILLYCRLLREVSDLLRAKALAECDRACRRLLEPQKALHHSALAGSVLAQDTEVISLLYFEIESVKDRHAVIGKRKVFTTDQTHFFSPSPSASRITSRFSLIIDT